METVNRKISTLMIENKARIKLYKKLKKEVEIKWVHRNMYRTRTQQRKFYESVTEVVIALKLINGEIKKHAYKS